MRTTIELPTDKRLPSARSRLFARAGGTGLDVRAAGSVSEITLYDEIGFWGVTAKAFKDRLDTIAGDIVLKINSPGGDAFDGIAIYNDLIAHRGNVRVEITGVAASAASIVAMAGTEIAIAPAAFLMVHKSWNLSIGNSVDHQEAAALLEQVDNALVDTYAERTGNERNAIIAMMAQETWLQGVAAVDAGFADEVISAADASEAAARFDLSLYAKAPGALRQQVSSGLTVNSKIELETWLRQSGASRSQAKAIVAGGFPALADNSTEIAALAAQITAATAALKGTTP